MQTFQYDYVLHMKRKFVIAHLLFLVVTWVLAGILKRDIFLLMQVPCLLSWDYFALFDKKHAAYKDEYQVLRYERIGTMTTTIGFGVLICIIICL